MNNMVKIVTVGKVIHRFISITLFRDVRLITCKRKEYCSFAFFVFGHRIAVLKCFSNNESIVAAMQVLLKD